MISHLDSRVMDANAATMGVSTETLMGNAGKCVADFLAQHYPSKRIGIICGHGNNGGDGYATACFLLENEISVYSIDPLDSIGSQPVLHYLKKYAQAIIPFEDCRFDFDVLVDCGLGTGISGSLKPAYKEYVEKVNSFNGTVVSVDVPTGLGTDTVVLPDVTIALHDTKTAMNDTNCGKIVVVDIGMPENAYRVTGPGDMLRYPLPSANSHKGKNGRLLIIGGGPYFGAPALAAMAALRTGTDLVTVAAPDSVYHEIASVNPTLMVQGLNGNILCQDHILDLLALSERNDAVLIGPGLGIDPDTIKTVNAFIAMCKKPMVIDADGINALSSSFKARTQTVITPHAAEFIRLTGQNCSDENAVMAASKLKNCSIVLKGKTDIISDGNVIRFNETGCAGMTGAGTGDVLAGIVAALLSKGMSAFDAGCLGAWISGKAGEKAFDKLSYGMIATDVIDSIPLVLKDGLNGRKNQ